jgi:hypothetical protein
MNLIDIIFFGWYHILARTVYSQKTDSGQIGPKEHSFFITFLFHGINLWTLISYLSAKYGGVDVPLYISLTLCLTVFGVGYLTFFRNKANSVLALNVGDGKVVFYVIVALIYVAVSAFLMFKIGDYVRQVVELQKT